MEFSALGAFGNDFGEVEMHCSDCVTCSDCIFSHDDSTYTHTYHTHLVAQSPLRFMMGKICTLEIYMAFPVLFFLCLFPSH